MKADEVMKVVKEFFEEHLNPVHRITSVNNKGNYVEAGVEVIEEKEYMKRYGRDQLIGMYQVRLNNKMEVTSFERIGLRKRTSTIEEKEKEEA
ncbi:gas vesicle protein GvpO [Alkalicoccus chagannorensis]|uniref:gas vesicle protein GvpO n=1 Tax=Alkalicoccus chagannorensis TaxID=427072 RepID=UPI00041A7FEE